MVLFQHVELSPKTNNGIRSARKNTGTGSSRDDDCMRLSPLSLGIFVSSVAPPLFHDTGSHGKCTCDDTSPCSHLYTCMWIRQRRRPSCILHFSSLDFHLRFGSLNYFFVEKVMYRNYGQHKIINCDRCIGFTVRIHSAAPVVIIVL